MFKQYHVHNLTLGAASVIDDVLYATTQKLSVVAKVQGTTVYDFHEDAFDSLECAVAARWNAWLDELCAP